MKEKPESPNVTSTKLFCCLASKTQDFFFRRSDWDCGGRSGARRIKGCNLPVILCELSKTKTKTKEKRKESASQTLNRKIQEEFVCKLTHVKLCSLTKALKRLVAHVVSNARGEARGIRWPVRDRPTEDVQILSGPLRLVVRSKPLSERTTESSVRKTAVTERQKDGRNTLTCEGNLDGQGT